MADGQKPVKLDMSTAQDLPQVKLDMSTAESLEPPKQPGISFPNLEREHPYAAAALEGPLDVLSGAGGELFSQAGRLAGLVSPRAGAVLSKVGAPSSTGAEPVGRYALQAAEYMAPGGLEARAGKVIGGALEKAPAILRGAANLVPAALSSGGVSALQGTGFLPGAALGAAGAPLGAAAERLGAKMATRAAGVTEKQLKYGAKPEQEILGLAGIRPGTIRESAQAKAGELTRQLEGKVDAATGTVDFTPAKEALNKAINKAADQRDLTTFGHLQQLADHVAQIPDQLPPREALDAKRGLGSLADFQSGAAVTKPAKAAARQVYHAADEALDKAVPEVNALDDRIHSLVTIAKPRGSGRAGIGGVLIPWLGERAAESMGGGPLAGLAGAVGAMAGMSPAARIAMGKVLAGAPALARSLRPGILGIVGGQ